MYRAGAAVLPRQGLPLAARSQYVYDRLKHPPGFHPLPARARPAPVLASPGPFVLRYQWPDSFPQRIRHGPRLECTHESYHSAQTALGKLYLRISSNPLDDSIAWRMVEAAEGRRVAGRWSEGPKEIPASL